MFVRSRLESNYLNFEILKKVVLGCGGWPNFELTLSLCGHDVKPGSQEFNNPWLALQAIMPATQC